MFDKLVPKGVFPKTIIRRINGFFYNAEYKKIECNSTKELLSFLAGYDKVIVKITIDSSSGHGVKLLSQSNGI